MEEIWSQINTYLSQQPWYIIALGTAILLQLFRRRQLPPQVVPHQASVHKQHHLQSALKTISPENISSFSVNSGSSFTFQGDDAVKLKDFLQRGDKIQAIKFVREKTGLDLAGAKNLVEKLESAGL